MSELTITQDGKVMTETQEGITMPADYSFATVNDYVHGVDRYFEELQWLALGMATHIDKIEKQRDELLAALEGLAGDIQSLIGESFGVDGLHMNGDIAPWSELEAGGRFERLTNLPNAYSAIASVKGGAA